MFHETFDGGECRKFLVCRGFDVIFIEIEGSGGKVKALRCVA